MDMIYPLRRKKKKKKIEDVEKRGEERKKKMEIGIFFLQWLITY